MVIIQKIFVSLYPQRNPNNMVKKLTKASKEAEEIGTSKELYNFLFEACNILRGPVSQDAFKEYITPLLYFKRISDVYDEETKAALELSDGDEEFAALPEQHRFVIPEGVSVGLNK